MKPSRVTSVAIAATFITLFCLIMMAVMCWDCAEERLATLQSCTLQCDMLAGVQIVSVTFRKVIRACECECKEEDDDDEYDDDDEISESAAQHFTMSA